MPRKLIVILTLVLSMAVAGQARAAGLPRVSPNDVPRYFVQDSYQYCDYGDLCAFVPYRSGYYRFDFRRCKQYRLANWYGRGFIINAQYGGVRFTLSDAKRRTILSSTKRRVFRGIGWSPVYFVRPCP